MGGACDCEVLGLLAWLGCLWLCLCVLWLMVWDLVLAAAWVGSMAMISGLFAVVGLLVRFGRAVWDVINITLFCLCGCCFVFVFGLLTAWFYFGFVFAL